jgi:hypothetical protein
MTFIFLTLGCVLVVVSSLLLRQAQAVSRWLSLLVFLSAIICFIGVYGNIGGVFVCIATTLLINLAVGVLFGKPSRKA